MATDASGIADEYFSLVHVGEQVDAVGPGGEVGVATTGTVCSACLTRLKAGNVFGSDVRDGVDHVRVPVCTARVRIN